MGFLGGHGWESEGSRGGRAQGKLQEAFWRAPGKPSQGNLGEAGLQWNSQKQEGRSEKDGPSQGSRSL